MKKHVYTSAFPSSVIAIDSLSLSLSLSLSPPSDDLMQMLGRLENSTDVDGSCRLARLLLDILEVADYKTMQVLRGGGRDVRGGRGHGRGGRERCEEGKIITYDLRENYLCSSRV